VRRVAVAGLVLVPLLMVAGCRGDSGSAPPRDNSPGGSVNQQFDDVEKTLDNIESEVNAG
jgi:hypothetical protein